MFLSDFVCACLWEKGASKTLLRSHPSKHSALTHKRWWGSRVDTERPVKCTSNTCQQRIKGTKQRPWRRLQWRERTEAKKRSHGKPSLWSLCYKMTSSTVIHVSFLQCETFNVSWKLYIPIRWMFCKRIHRGRLTTATSPGPATRTVYFFLKQ